MTRPQLLTYVASLKGEMFNLFFTVDRIVKEEPDTLSEEFQLAASIRKLYESRAADWLNTRESH